MSLYSYPIHADADGDYECREDRGGVTKREDYYWCLEHRVGKVEKHHETEKAILFSRADGQGFWVPKSLLVKRGEDLCVWCGFRPKWISISA